MLIIPEKVARFRFDQNNILQTHPTCGEAEPNYKKLFGRGRFNTNGTLFGFTSELIGQVILAEVFDPFEFAGTDSYLSTAVLKNPHQSLIVRKTEDLGFQNGLLKKDGWLYLARTAGSNLIITRPVRPIYYSGLNDQMKDSLTNVDLNKIPHISDILSLATTSVARGHFR